MKNKFYIIIITYWLTLEFLIDGLTHFFSVYRFLNIVENAISIAFVILLISQLGNEKLRRYAFLVATILIGIMIWFETIMYYLFKISFGPSSYYVFLNTNPDELSGFLREYVDIYLLGITLLFIIPLFQLKRITNSFRLQTNEFELKNYKWLKVGLISIVVLFGLRSTSLIDHNLAYLTARSIVLNYKESKYIDQFNAELNTKKNIVINSNDDINNTFLVVIGESTTSSHMQLYGYYRPTTPRLQALKDSLLIFKNVISPNTSTFHSLSKALTLGNYEEPEKVLAFPITGLFNKAGFKTFWISNHSPAFNPDSDLARVSNKAEFKFHNAKEAVMNNVKHDGDLLSKVANALNDSAKHKIIFLHLIGTHFSYDNRYPTNFDVFKDKPKTDFQDNLAYTKINQYDNAILYNDFIVSEVLNKLKNKNTNSYLLYFSDHGEEVFKDENFYGHLEDRPTTDTYKIPFLLWYNRDFNLPQDFVFDADRKYMTDDLWHSIAHISGLKSDYIDLNRSVFSSQFRERKRIILEDKDFDTMFK
ncbi:sulfatase-like hydrolase/transferase [Changchengzhania lutea]|uniref:sulfatase-like hydrolase/transferase n=1 Tax=Changchengzhania lutea TaxID=2049305 RepID=UPI00115C8537|nr:sulfatase-like hydrolase/transferase [Changchengzhania lutea]